VGRNAAISAGVASRRRRHRYSAASNKAQNATSATMTCHLRWRYRTFEDYYTDNYTAAAASVIRDSFHNRTYG
jgi:hypothetical protein